MLLPVYNKVLLLHNSPEFLAEDLNLGPGGDKFKVYWYTFLRRNSNLVPSKANRLAPVTIALSLRESRSVTTRGDITKLSSPSLLSTE